MAAKQPPKKISGKLIVAGPANAGKTCLIERFVNDHFAADDASHGPTLGTDCYQKSIYSDDTEVRLFIYDTAGQERFADMTASYYRVGDVCLLCFDMSNLATFDNTKWWMKKVADHNDRCSFILVGTKEDLVSDSTLDIKPISQWAEQSGIPFFPTSALKGGDHVRFLFHTVAEKCIRLSRDKQLYGGGSGGKDTTKLASTIGKQHIGCCQAAA